MSDVPEMGLTINSNLFFISVAKVSISDGLEISLFVKSFKKRTNQTLSPSNSPIKTCWPGDRGQARNPRGALLTLIGERSYKC